MSQMQEVDWLLVRLEMAENAIADLQARLPTLRADVRAIAQELRAEQGPPWRRDPSMHPYHQGESSDYERQRTRDRHVEAVEGALRQRFGGALELPEEYWWRAAEQIVDVAEVGI